MGAHGRLCQMFVAGMPGSTRTSFKGGPELESALEFALVVCRKQFPKVLVKDEDFIGYVGARLDSESASNLSEARALDLFLACGCSHGEKTAIVAFEQTYIPDLERALARMRIDGARAEENIQVLRQHLLVGAEGRPPKIADYNGQGELRGWLRVTAVRAALKASRKDKRERLNEEDAVLEQRASGDDPELSHMKAIYRDAFRASFRDAFTNLDAREKNLIRQNLLDGLSIDELGTLYGVHRATAARWLQKAKDRLLADTRKHFVERVKVNSAECDSILRIVQSRLDITIRRLLA